MSDIHWEKPKIASLSLRRVTRYMMALAREWDAYGVPDISVAESERPPVSVPRGDYQAPAIPDPWDVGPSAQQGQKQRDYSIPRTLSPEEAMPEPAGVLVEPVSQRTGPWADGPSTVAKERAGAGSAEEIAAPPGSLGELFWAVDADAEDIAPAPWELPEADAREQDDGLPIRSGAPSKEQDDFNRAMMYLSQDDDFLVTGVGKRAVPEEARADGGMPAERPDMDGAGRNGEEPAGMAEARPEKGAGLSVRGIVAIALIVLILAAAGFAIWYFFLGGREDVAEGGTVQASVVYIEDESMGCVEDGLAVQLAMEMMRERVEMDTMLPAVIDKEIRIEAMRVDARYIAPQKEMEQAVLDACSVLVEGYGVYVDGRLVGVAHSTGDVEAVMREGLDPFEQIAAGNRDIRDLQYAEAVEVKPVTVLPEKLLSYGELYALLISGDEPEDGQQDYQVVSGDSLIAIANNHDMTLGQIRYANPRLIGKDLIQIGETLSLAPPQGLLTVQFTERVTEEIKNPFETVTETSDKMYTTQSEVKVKGVDGLREVTADRIYVAGVNVGETILEEKIITEAVGQVIVKGTKKVENASGNSVYVWPAQGTISSKFGERWGRMHNGLDIAAATGTPIYAARDGKVTFSGTNGDYGKMIKIDHGGGIETRYAHCSVLKVSSGTSVKKGQLIALVGSTGNSTGPHLHFEIRVNGDAKNPSNYLPSQ